MKKILYTICLLALGAFGLSCTDDALDPLKTKEVKKGTILALRGTQLNNIYFDGVPGAEFFPRVIQGTEVFTFDAEYLSEDPGTLASFDMYVIKKTENGDDITTERVFLRNVPFSEFKTTEEYSRPWVTVSIKLTDLFAKIGITDYTDPTAVASLLDLYQPGINIESDLNLSDGSTVPASIILASGLFDSDQFYPAQKLTYNATEFCPYDNTWETTYKAVELYANGDVSDFYEVTLVQDAVNPNKFTFDNFMQSTNTVTIEFDEAYLSPSEASISFTDVIIDGVTYSGSGSYNQCDGNFSLSIENSGDEDASFTYQFELPD